jgi:hypothetical protein
MDVRSVRDHVVGSVVAGSIIRTDVRHRTDKTAKARACS